MSAQPRESHNHNFNRTESPRQEEERDGKWQ